MSKKRRVGYSRAQRVGQQIYELISQLLLVEVDDPRLKEVQISGVDLSRDLRNGKVYHVLLSGGAPSKGVQKAVEGIRGFVRGRIGAELQLQYVPELEFRFDEAVLEGRRIDELLSKLRDD